MAASLNPYISKFDEGIDVEQSSNYKMTIQFSLGGLSFALLDTRTKCIIGLECHQTDFADGLETFPVLERALDSKELNNSTLQSVTCLIDERTNIIIPEPLHHSEDDGVLLGFHHQIPSGSMEMTDRIEMIHGVNRFVLPKALHDSILSRWEKVTITHSSSVFIDSSLNYAPEGKAAFVNVRSRDFDMLIVDDGKLLFFNNFKFNTKADFAYFLLFALEQNHFSALDHPVCFSGLILSNSEIVELCSRYIRHLLFIEDRHELYVSQALDDVPFQYYHLLYQSLR